MDDDVGNVLKINIVCERDSDGAALRHILSCLLKPSTQKSAALAELQSIVIEVIPEIKWSST
jgi:hypothetical protein